MKSDYFTVPSGKLKTVTSPETNPTITHTGSGSTAVYTATYIIKVKKSDASGVEISGIPYGTTYTVTENLTSSQSSANWKTVKYDYSDRPAGSESAELIIANNSAADTATVTNALTGDLVLKKTLTGNTSIAPSGPFKFNVTLTPPGTMTAAQLKAYSNDLSDFTVSGSNLTKTVSVPYDASNNTGFTLHGLPYGTTYAVEEADESKDKTSKVEYSTNNGTDYSTTSVSGQTIGSSQSVLVRNTYPNVNSLRLKKTISGTTVALSTARVSKGSNGTQFKYKVDLKVPDGMSIDLTDFITTPISGAETGGTYDSDHYYFEVKVKDDDNHFQIDNIPQGVEFKVVEERPDYTLVEHTVQNEVTEYTELTSSNNVVNITNTYTSILGTLSLNKQRVAANTTTVLPAAENSRTFKFNVTLKMLALASWYNTSTLSGLPENVTVNNPDEISFKVDVTDGNTYQITGIPLGMDYKVTEDFTNGYYTEPDTGNVYYVTKSDEMSDFAKINLSNPNAIVTIKNTYLQVGKLTLKKELAAETTDTPATDFIYKVVLTAQSGMNLQTYNTNNGVITLNEGKRFVDGTTGNPITTPALYGTYGADGSTYTFYVKVNAGDGGSVEVNNIPYGTAYEVTEMLTTAQINAGWINGVDKYGTTTAETQGDDTVYKHYIGAEDESKHNTFTSYNSKTAELVLNEVLLNGKSTHSDDRFTFTVSFTAPENVVFTDGCFTFKDQNGNEIPNESVSVTPNTQLTGATVINGANITVDISENIKSIKISGIPYGTKYTVNGSQDPITGTVIPAGSTWSLVSEEYSSEIPENETQHVINAPTQSFTAENAITGGMKISKTIKGTAVPDDSQFTFTLTLSDIPSGVAIGDNDITAKDSSNNPITISGTGNTRTFTITGEDTVTVLGISQDTKVTVSEGAMSGANWQQTNVSNSTVTIGDDPASAEAEFENTYTPTSITLFKQDASSHAGIPNAEFYLLKLNSDVDIESDAVKTAFASAEHAADLGAYASVVGSIQTTQSAPNDIEDDGDDDNVPGTITITADNTNITFEAGDRYFFFEETAGTIVLEGPKTIYYNKDNSLTPEKVITINSYQYDYSVTYDNERQPESTGVDVTKKGTDGKYLGGAVFDLFYQDTNIPRIFNPNDPFAVPNFMSTTSVNDTIAVPDPQTITGEAVPTKYTYRYGSEDVPAAEDKEWILPRSDNDYIYFRDYNKNGSSLYSGDYGWGKNNNPDDDRRWINTWFQKNDFSQEEEIFYDHRYWLKAVFTAPGKETREYAVWERFVDEYGSSHAKTVVWKIQPPDGYKYVEFILCDGDNHVRNTEKFQYVLGNIYTKSGKDRYDGGQYGYPVVGEHWSTNWNNTGNTAVDKRQNYSSIYNSSSGSYWQNTNAIAYTGASGTSSQDAPKQTERYTPTEQKIVFHCNSKRVWHNIHIEFFKEGTSSDYDFTQTEGSVTKYYKHVGQGAPGYLMEPYAYAGDDYRINGYLTYELTIPAEATHFRVNNGVIGNNSTYNFRSEITKLHNAEDRNGRKNYGNYFKIADGDRNVSSSKAIKMTDWTSYPTGSGKDKWNESYSSIDVSSDYDYVYFEAPSNWGSHVYAYFYAGGDLRQDNWQRAVYSIWPGEAAVSSEYAEKNVDDTESAYHSDTYGYSYEGALYGTAAKTASPTNPESTFKKGTKTVYKFRIPKGDRTNYKKVIFNNGLSTQVQPNGTNGSDGKLHETGVISYSAGYLYNEKGKGTKYYDNKSTSTYQKRGDADTDDYIYIKVPSALASTWDNMHITFYDSANRQILQQGDGYVMEYSGINGGYTYYRMAIPTNAEKFALNNGYNSSVKTKSGKLYDILRMYNENIDSDGSAVNYTKDRLVYELKSDSGNYDLKLTSPYSEVQPYLYVRINSTDTAALSYWENMHVKFYDNGDNQLPDNTAASDFAMTYYGDLTDTDSNTYKYFRAAIPEGTAKYELNDGASPAPHVMPKTTIDISSYDPDRDIYTLSGASTTLTHVSFGNLPGELDTVSSQSDNHDYTIRQSPDDSADDYIYIRDNAGWNIGIGSGNVRFYDENGSLITGSGTGGDGTYTLIVTKHEDNDSNKPVWYKVSIPQTAKTFAVSYTIPPADASGSPTFVSTTAYDIYPYGDSTSEVDHTENGNMYYQTEDGAMLSLISSTIEVSKPAKFDYTTRDGENNGGDTLYLVCANKADWDGMTVTFSGTSTTTATPEYLGEITYEPIEPISGVSSSDPDAVGHWFRAAIPQGATSFTVTKDAKTSSGVIYDLRDKPTRYEKDWTSGDMQYRLPDNGGKAVLLYPVFTEEELQTVEVGGQTVYSQDGVSQVDVSQLERFLGKDTAKQTEYVNGNVSYPVLYKTDDSKVTYQWTVDNVYFKNDQSWSSVICTFLNGSNTVSTQTKNGTGVLDFNIPNADVDKVRFSDGGTNSCEFTLTNGRSDAINKICEYVSGGTTSGYAVRNRIYLKSPSENGYKKPSTTLARPLRLLMLAVL